MLVSLVCPHCQEPFQIRRCWSYERKYCSHSCAMKARHQRNSHRRYGTSIYTAWVSMKTRCSNPKCDRFANYGGRGIKVCERWNDFRNFLTDMGEKPSPKHSLDRIDTNGDYTPENCRWATMEQQYSNRTDSHLLTFNGKTQTITQWSRELGFNHSALVRRLQRGWSVEETLTIPLQKAKYIRR